MDLVLDAIVVGLGAAGSATAWQLAARGQQVIGFDALTPPHDRGSSHGSLRITRKAIGEGEAYVPLVLRSNELWRSLEREQHASLLQVTGGLWISSPQRQAETHVANFFDNTVTAARHFQVEHEILDAPAVRRRFPQFAIRDNEIAYYEPDAGFLRPEACVSSMLAAAAHRGAQLHPGERVLHFHEERDGVAVLTERGAYRASRLVLCAGPWVRELVEPRVAALFSVTPQVQYWFEIAGDAREFEPGRCPVWIWELQERRNVIYGFPAADGAAAGVKVATEQYAETTSPGRMEREVSPERVDAMYRELVAPYLRGVGPACLRTQPCLYTATPDFHFVVDRLPGTSRVVLVSACSGHGFKHAAALGEMAADLATGSSGTLRREPFSIDRLL